MYMSGHHTSVSDHEFGDVLCIPGQWCGRSVGAVRKPRGQAVPGNGLDGDPTLNSTLQVGNMAQLGGTRLESQHLADLNL